VRYTSCLHPWLKKRIRQCVEAAHKDLLQWVVASLPGRMMECGGSKRLPAKYHFRMLMVTITFTVSKMCVYSLNKLFFFSLNPLMRKSETVAFR